MSQTNHFPLISLRVGLLIVLLASATGVLSSVTWIYHRIHNSLGLEVAEVSVAVLMILILGLILVGFAVGFGARRVLRQRKDHACRIYQSMKWSKIFRAFWGHIGLHADTEINSVPYQESTVETIVLPDRRSRRGRRPTYSIDRWIKVVSAWENQDPWRNPLTLTEFLSEEFGTNADGSPRMSEKSYYDWSKKVHEELKKRAALKNVSA